MAETTAVLRVRLHGTDYVLVGTLDEGGAIASEADFLAGRVSHAHLYPDGNICRFGEVIALREDLTVVGPAEIEVDPAAILAGCFCDPSWEADRG